MIFENKHSVLNIDFGSGKIISLKEKTNGRGLLAKLTPFCEAILHNGKCCPSCTIEQSEACYQVRFQDTEGSALFRITVKEEYIVFGVVEADIPELETLNFCVLEPSPTRYKGMLLSMASDDEYGVCIRALNYETMSMLKDTRLFAQTYRFNGTFSGCEAILIAAQKKEIPGILQHVAIAEQVPCSTCGGAWAQKSELNRASYIFGDIHGKDLDSWIRIAKRGGFQILHFHEWWTSWGHYTPKKAFFPGGFAQLKDCFDKLHEAGLKGGLHMLSGCIQPHDPWVTPIPSRDLADRGTYTLTKNISETDTVVTVNKKPNDLHHLFWSYSGNGNALRIDDEIIQYEGISKEEPFQFTKCIRGAFGTKPATHTAGAKVDYLRQRYIAFYPKIGSPLFYNMIERIGAIYKACKADMIYMDGAEGIGERNEADYFRWELIKRLSPMLMQTSDWSPNIWWFCSGLGAWDIPFYAPKKFIDMHMRISQEYPKSDFLPCQMGWWVFLGATKEYRAQTMDVVDYYGTKNLALDASTSIQMTEYEYDKQQNARMFDMLTVLGWYERIRLARYFTQESIDGIRKPGEEFRMRLNPDGYWKLRKIHPLTVKTDGGTNSWHWNNPAKEQPLNLRIESLYKCADHDGKVLADFSQGVSFVNGNVKLSTIHETIAGTKEITQTRLVAENATDTRRGVWVQVAQDHPIPYFNLGKSEAVSVWIKGDGSGALLNFQMHCPAEFAAVHSEHYVTLDFCGWKHFELHFRERDGERLNDYIWPYGELDNDHAIYGTLLNQERREHVDRISVWLNDIPAHGKVDVAFTPFTGHPVEDSVLRNPLLTVNGKRVVLPVELHSDEYAELENGTLSRYNASGILQETIPFDAPVIRQGENVIGLESGGRAEMRLFTLGDEFGELNPEYNPDAMKEEYELPVGITEQESESVPLYVRAGMTAKLSFDLFVQKAQTPVSDLILSLDDKDYIISAAALSEGSMLRCDGKTWRLMGHEDREQASGELSAPLPLLNTVKHSISLRFTCKGKHLVFLNVKKDYAGA